MAMDEAVEGRKVAQRLGWGHAGAGKGVKARVHNKSLSPLGLLPALLAGTGLPGADGSLSLPFASD